MATIHYDGSRGSLLAGSDVLHHQVDTLGDLEAAQTVTADVVGPICETGDVIARSREVGAAEPGELMAVLSAGAYGFTMASNYNSRPRGAEVLVDGDRFDVVRKAETVEELMASETIPAHLDGAG